MMASTGNVCMDFSDLPESSDARLAFPMQGSKLYV